MRKGAAGLGVLFPLVFEGGVRGVMGFLADGGSDGDALAVSACIENKRRGNKKRVCKKRFVLAIVICWLYVGYATPQNTQCSLPFVLPG